MQGVCVAALVTSPRSLDLPYQEVPGGNSTETQRERLTDAFPEPESPHGCYFSHTNTGPSSACHLTSNLAQEELCPWTIFPGDLGCAKPPSVTISFPLISLPFCRLTWVATLLLT